MKKVGWLVVSRHKRDTSFSSSTKHVLAKYLMINLLAHKGIPLHHSEDHDANTETRTLAQTEQIKQPVGAEKKLNQVIKSILLTGAQTTMPH